VVSLKVLAEKLGTDDIVSGESEVESANSVGLDVEWSPVTVVCVSRDPAVVDSVETACSVTVEALNDEPPETLDWLPVELVA
jgi:hypothetical protein